MKDRPRARRSSLGLGESLVWMAGLASLSGLVAEVVRGSSLDSPWSLVSGLFALFMVYLAISALLFWRVKRVAIPATLLIGSLLWTLTLQSIEKLGPAHVLIATILIPLATVSAGRWIGAAPAEPDALVGDPGRPSPLHALLEKGINFGSGADRSARSIEAGRPEIRWVEPVEESLKRG